MLKPKQDRKVVRWCLNCLAQIGTRQGSERYIILALSYYDDDPEITAAGIAALTNIYRGHINEITAFSGFDRDTRILAALQNTPPERLDLSGFRIDIDKASTETLKLALITVGLNRDIENLFHPKISNGQFVKALGQHPDSIVVQYSVWSVIENRRLTITDLGVPLRPLDEQPPNVQAKLLQLVAERESDILSKHDLISQGTTLPSPDAREGLARGIVRQYYDGLEGVIVDWFAEEVDPVVRKLLAQHFARFSEQFPPYEELALAALEEDPSLRDSLLVGAQGMPLWAKLARSDIRSGTPDLFGGLDVPLIAAVRRNSGRVMKVLFLSAAPVNQGRLRVDEEARELREQIRLVANPQTQLDIWHEWAVRTDQIQAAILNERPEILHFSGHGAPGALCFEDRTGRAKIIGGKEFAELVELNNSTIRCVVLNACFSDDVARQTKTHVEAVVGSTKSISDGAAVEFSRAFYRAIAHGKNFEQAFRLARNDVALNSGTDEADKFVFL